MSNRLARTTATPNPSRMPWQTNRVATFCPTRAVYKAGKACKWQHSWENVDDKASRCWICGAKDHRKSECKPRSSTRKPGEPAGSCWFMAKDVGGVAAMRLLHQSQVHPLPLGGKAGAAAPNFLNGSEQTTTSTSTSEGSNEPPPEVTSVATVEEKRRRK